MFLTTRAALACAFLLILADAVDIKNLDAAKNGHEETWEPCQAGDRIAAGPDNGGNGHDGQNDGDDYFIHTTNNLVS